MRLLRTDLDDESDLELKEFYGEDVPSYAIVSHTWQDDELSFQDIQSKTGFGKNGYTKVRNSLRQARRDNLNYLWIDTVCIDKTSSAELSEAINSMFAWYSCADRCYAYLFDVEWTDHPLAVLEQSLPASRWWTRGWCLQELLAPRDIDFFSSAWEFLGTRSDLKDKIAASTGIDEEFIDGSLPLSSASIAKRMSWASLRKTTRLEDMAYCLMGIFEVNMPLLYGEGTRAFIRLQEEIMRHSDDQSLFAWRLEDEDYEPQSEHGLLADSPKAFLRSGHIHPYTDWVERKPYGITNRGLSIELGLSQTSNLSPDLILAALQCPPPLEFDGYLAICLKRIEGTKDEYTRIQCNSFHSLARLGELTSIYIRQGSTRRPKAARYPDNFFSLRHLEDEYTPNISSTLPHYRMTEYSCAGLTSWEQKNLPQAETGIETWVQLKGSPMTVYRIVSSAGRLTAVIMLRGASQSGGTIAVLLGLISNRDIGFDVCQVDEGSRRRTPRVEEYSPHFAPKPMGSSMTLPPLQVRVEAEETVVMGKKIYLVDIFLMHARKSSSSKAIPFTWFNGYSIKKARPVES